MHLDENKHYCQFLEITAERPGDWKKLTGTLGKEKISSLASYV